MVTALGGCGAAAATVQPASIGTNAAEMRLVSIDESNKICAVTKVCALGATPTGAAQHV
jgi:hypothetical protein